VKSQILLARAAPEGPVAATYHFRLTVSEDRVRFLPMKRLNHGSSMLPLTLLVLLVVTLIGHVCVLPLHGHVEAADRHADAEQSHDADEAVHAAPCEMLPSSVVACPAIFGASAPVAATPVQYLNGVSSNRIVFSAISPPLFLLHASLLI
jgi:hypothetical protein